MELAPGIPDAVQEAPSINAFKTQRREAINNKWDIDASGLRFKDILDIPGLMDIPDWDCHVF